MGFGDSGLFRAASSQLEDLVGLQRLGSIVLEGLVGGVVRSGSSGLGAVGSVVFVSMDIAAGSRSWLEVGRDGGRGELSFDRLPGRDGDVPPRRVASILFRDAIESARCKPVGEVTLHRLTLSVRFIIALCTKPPMPFVGERGLVGDVRPEGGDITGWLSFADAAS